jgi:hypothetical protein
MLKSEEFTYILGYPNILCQVLNYREDVQAIGNAHNPNVISHKSGNHATVLAIILWCDDITAAYFYT